MYKTQQIPCNYKPRCILPRQQSAEWNKGIITRSSVLQFEVLVRKLPSIDRLPSSSIVISEITSL